MDITHAIKGFDANLQCRGFQFEAGKTFIHDGPIKACQNGFHAIIGHPLSVLGYYAPSGSRFFRVEISGQADSDDQEKIAGEILKVGQEIGISGLVADAIKWVTDRSTPEGETATGDLGAASATGTRGAASATGYQGAASATGTRGAAISCLSGKVTGKDGNALFAIERDDDFNIVSVACGVVGKKGIKPDVWYAAKNGKLIAA